MTDQTRPPTPTPWWAVTHGRASLIDGHAIMGPHENGTQTLAILHWRPGEVETAKANAALIVLSVNAHEALVKAMELIDQLSRCPKDFDPADEPRDLRHIQTHVRAALALSRGETP